MYYLFVTLVLGAFIGGSALMSNNDYTHSTETSLTAESFVDSESAATISNTALSADTSVSLSL